MGMDLSYLEALMGGAAADTGGGTGGVWVVSPEGAVDDGILRLVGKARIVADTLGTYVHLLLGGGAAAETGETAIKASADRVLLAAGVPGLADLAALPGAGAPGHPLPAHTIGANAGAGPGADAGWRIV